MTSPADLSELTPPQIVAYLDRFIVGQARAKRAVAVAMRNRWRRQRLAKEAQKEIYPKNIILIGPTGVGKTEIARRMASLQKAPFLKVEASKYSQVGYHGRDVETMVRDLLEVGIDIVRQEKMLEVENAARDHAHSQIVEALLRKMGPSPEEDLPAFTPFGSAGILAPSATRPPAGDTRRQEIRARLDKGELEDEMVMIRVTENVGPGMEMFSGQGPEYVGFDASFLAKLRGMPTPMRDANVTVASARKLLMREEAEKLFDREAMIRDAIERTEQCGILFIDEIDKIAGRSRDGGPDVSREGVQRDLLPVVEGCSVYTRHGNVNTDHVLFIAAGAFHISSPDDLIPEIQGRFPIRVQLDSLGRDEFVRILTEPRDSLTKQYQRLLLTDGVELDFRPDGLEEIALLADRANVVLGDIGARRLHGVLERLLEGVSYDAPDLKHGKVAVDKAFVRQALADFTQELDVTKR
ncbi:MAG: ATP-dependent protease ATPase subunit HslU [Planctomycetes bacterium]|nr:ATP-dependent protease ATPase subunit HslU [Planctomycetota bacterium]